VLSDCLSTSNWSWKLRHYVQTAADTLCSRIFLRKALSAVGRWTLNFVIASHVTRGAVIESNVSQAAGHSIYCTAFCGTVLRSVSCPSVRTVRAHKIRTETRGNFDFSTVKLECQLRTRGHIFPSNLKFKAGWIFESTLHCFISLYTTFAVTLAAPVFIFELASQNIWAKVGGPKNLRNAGTYPAPLGWGVADS